MLCQFLLYNEASQPYVYIYPLSLEPPSPFPLLTSLGHHRSPSCAIQQLPTSYLFYTWEYVFVNPNLPIYPHALCPFSTSTCPFLLCKQVHLYHFSIFHIYALIYDACFSLSDHCKSGPDETMCSDQSLIFTVLGQRRRSFREDVGLGPKGEKPSICYQLLVRR